MVCMSERILSPDRHLRQLATRHLRDVDPSLRQALKDIKANPELIVDRARGFDAALLRLEFFMIYPDRFIAEQDRGKYQNLAVLRDMLKGQELSDLSIGSLSHESQTNQHPSGKIVKALTDSEETFVAVASLIKSGEWGYLKELESPGMAISALLIEGYGLFLERHYRIEDLRPVFVRAFEEVLGVEFSSSSLWLEVKPWVIEEQELFSKSFVESIG